MMSMLSIVADFFLPTTCVLCHAPTLSAEHHLCHRCQLPATLARCQKCATPLKETLCGACQKTPPPWRYTVAPLDYKDGTRFCIHQLKYHHKTYIAQTLATQFLKHLRPDFRRPDFIIPVPLHKKKLYQRHFNQSYLLAKAIGKALRIPVKTNLCQRIKATESQTGKTITERAKNLHNAFTVTQGKALFNQSIVVLDDVYTTGATLTALCKALQKHQPKRIEVWCMARTTRP